MPELPEVETIKNQLNSLIAGQKIKNIFVYTDKMVKVGPGKISNIKTGDKKSSGLFRQRLLGKKIVKVTRRAKYLLLEMSPPGWLMIHLRMSGQLIYMSKKDLGKAVKLSLAKAAVPQKLPSKHTHVAITFSGADRLFYNDTRQFGHLRFVNSTELAAVLTAQNLGPEPLALSFKEFKKIIAGHLRKRVKDLLLNQHVIAGIGNIYADEALFIARIHPLRKTSGLTEKEIAVLYAAIRKVLRNAIQAGGSSIEYFLMTNGAAGKYSQQHLVYGKAGKKCRRCGSVLKAIKIGSRTATFCPRCQKLLY